MMTLTRNELLEEILRLVGVNEQAFSGGGTIDPTTDLVINTGNNTLIMPLTYNRILDIKSISGTATLDPGTNTFESGNTVTATVNRRMYLDGTVWIEL
jgi:hypothetical protein